jgi:Zn-dependent metalloprotease
VICRFCKSEISDGATRCPNCTSFLTTAKEDSAADVTYIVDRGIVKFAKFAIPIFGIFLVIGLSFYLTDLKQLSKEVEETYAASQKLDISIKGAELDLRQQTAKIKADVDHAEEAAADAAKALEVIKTQVAQAKDAAADAAKALEVIKTQVAQAKDAAAEATTALSMIQDLRSKALQSEQDIEVNRAKALVLIAGFSTVPSSASDPAQLQRLVEAKLVEMLRDILPQEQYTRLQARIDSEKKAGTRQIYDAKNGETLPGALLRSEGDAPASDEIANRVYENLQTIRDFFTEALGRDIIGDTGGSLTATIHYGKGYDNTFWNGQQIVIGDGDGEVFATGQFSSLSVIANEVAHALTKGLNYQDQAGAINSSFSNIVATVILQWKDKQLPSQATWLVGEGVFLGEGAKALVSVKAPGTAYDSPTTGRDPQVSTMARFVKTSEDNGGVHINSGIPNKAFYEVATRIGGCAWDKPLKIWYQGIAALKPDATFQNLADATVEAAARIYGPQSAERDTVIQGWAAVGIVTGAGAPG